jgi:hypothetical protein
MAGEGKFIDNLAKGDIRVDGSIVARNVKRTLIDEFRFSPVMSAVLGSAATATSASLMRLGDKTYLTTPIIGQTLIAPVLAATGLDIAGDQTDNDGREIDFSGAGVLGARSPYSYVVGGPAFYGKLKFSLGDVSGTDVCAFGFRKAAAHNADLYAYTDYAVLNIVSGNISTTTEINAGTHVTTDTTLDWADGESHEVAIYVNTAGVVTFKVDGATPPTVGTCTLDAGDVMIPFFQFLHDGDLCDTMILQYLEVGLQ